MIQLRSKQGFAGEGVAIEEMEVLVGVDTIDDVTAKLTAAGVEVLGAKSTSVITTNHGSYFVVRIKVSGILAFIEESV